MKKLFALMLAIVFAVAVVSARDRVTTDVNYLPQVAQQILKKHFPKAAVNHIKIDSKTFGGKEYDVVLNNGTEIEFDDKGEWKDIDAGMNGVPASIVPESIATFVKKNHRGQKIVSIDRSKKGYEVELSGGLDLKFNRYGHFVRIDD